MSPHAQLVFAIGVTTLIIIGAILFTLWLTWALFWDVFDFLMQRRTRRRNAAFDARVGRDCYRDIRGVTR